MCVFVCVFLYTYCVCICTFLGNIRKIFLEHSIQSHVFASVALATTERTKQLSPWNQQHCASECILQLQCVCLCACVCARREIAYQCDQMHVSTKGHWKHAPQPLSAKAMKYAKQCYDFVFCLWSVVVKASTVPTRESWNHCSGPSEYCVELSVVDTSVSSLSLLSIHHGQYAGRWSHPDPEEGICRVWIPICNEHCYRVLL